MNQNSGGLTCTIGCLLIAALGGMLVAVLLASLAGFAFVAAVFFGFIAAAIAAVFLMWAFCRRLPAPGEVHISAQAPVAAKAPVVPAAPVSAPAPEPVAQKPAAAMAAPAATPAVQPSAALAGEAELASRKGEWSYQGDTKAAPAAEKAPAPKAKAPEPASEVAYSEADKPELLSAARDGGADDLKQIKGVGKVMEDMMHDMGVYHFDQVASWSPQQVAWVDANLPKFKGRISRDGWVDQAKILATGGETEFSRKVEKGGFYDG